MTCAHSAAVSFVNGIHVDHHHWSRLMSGDTLTWHNIFLDHSKSRTNPNIFCDLSVFSSVVMAENNWLLHLYGAGHQFALVLQIWLFGYKSSMLSSFDVSLRLVGCEQRHFRVFSLCMFFSEIHAECEGKTINQVLLNSTPAYDLTCYYLDVESENLDFEFIWGGCAERTQSFCDLQAGGTRCLMPSDKWSPSEDISLHAVWNGPLRTLYLTCGIFNK